MNHSANMVHVCMYVHQTRQSSRAHSDERLHKLTLYSTQAPLDAFEMNSFLNIMKNGTFAPEEQMFHSP